MGEIPWGVRGLDDVDLDPGVSDLTEIAGQLRVSVGMLVRRLKQTRPDGELTLAESSTLSRLERSGPATSSELARLDKISPQSMGTVIAAMEERGLIARERDPGDGRRIAISITEAGRRIVHERRGARVELIARALGSGFTRAELEQLKAAAPLLERLAEKM